MKEEILERLVAVLNALDNVSVRGKQNLANLSGSIAILEEVHNCLIECEVTHTKKEAQSK